MLLAHPAMISEIDKYAAHTLGIPMRELMYRAGAAVANAVRSCVPGGSKISVFAGKGNNGGDGYAAALILKDEYNVTVYDVFSCGQRTDEGRYFLDSFALSGGKIKTLKFDEATLNEIRSSDAVIDAVFGTGFVGELPDTALQVANLFSSLTHIVKIAIDTPLGVNASDGSVIKAAAYHADITVALGFVKTGLVSYPAKEYVGKLIYDNIDLHNEAILREFSFFDYCIDYDLASTFIPIRKANSNKGTFGKLLMISGSFAFAGAAHLSLESALRMGVGLVTYLGEKALCDSLVAKLPEAIYKTFSPIDATDEEIRSLVDLSLNYTAALVGPGSSRSDGLYRLIRALLSSEGSPLILDADAINVLDSDALMLIRDSRRQVILTPHPLEFSRISGIPVDEVQENRLSVAKAFARDHNCILVLKGAATVVTDGALTYINSSGSSALAKAGSGDVLAGAISSLVASGTDPLRAAALAVYLHGLAADELASELSELGVTPSDLPRGMARQIALLQKKAQIT